MNENLISVAIGMQDAAADDDATLFLGENLLPWLLFAFGSALVVANIAALVRPPRIDPKDPSSPRNERASLTRVVPFMVVGALVAAWALASLLGS